MLKSNTRLSIGNRPMVLLPLDVYERINTTLKKVNFINEKNLLALTSEPSLSKDWLRLEEEKAWKDL